MTNKNTRNRNNIILRENDNRIVDSNEVCEILTITLQILLPLSDLKMVLPV